MRLVQDLKRQLGNARLEVRRPSTRSTVLTLVLLVGACAVVSCDHSGLPYEEDEEPAFETEPESKTPEVADARIQPKPGTMLAEGIVLEEASPQEGDLVEESFSPRTGRRYLEGRRCLLITGQIRNTSTEARNVDIWVDGYSAKGERVASTLISETQPGHVHLAVPAGAGREFEVYLEWPSRLSSLQFRTAGEGVAVPRSYAEEQMLDVNIEPDSGAFVAEGIILEEASTHIAALEHTSFTVETGQHHTKGDWCVLVSGQMHNTTSTTRDVDMWVDGYNAEGERVASTIASETQEGYLHLDVPGETSQDFELRVSWSDEIRSLKFTADIDDRMIPSAPMSPSSRLPEGLTVNPLPGEYLATSPDGARSELLLLTIEVEQIESPERYWSYRDERYTVEQGEPILVVSGVIQNRHRTYSEISMTAHGYDSAGEQVSFTLDSAHLPGCIGLKIPPGETGEFTLHMNPDEDVTSIHIYGGTSPIPPP